MPNRKGLSVALKTAKGWKVLSSELMWKAVMIVSQYPKPNKTVLLVSTAHGEPDIFDVYTS